MALNDETEAVFKSVRTKVDPVSGNEVPPGSLPEEVRDDIPAMLSEGEYVVPADVLRYYGMKFFEDLRAQAKMGLADMEANGRIGGEPVEEQEELPFSDDELETVEMNEGGLVGFQEGGINLPPETQVTDYTSEAFQLDPSDPTQVMMGSQPGGSGYELVTYYGPNGETVNIPFFNGMPLGIIPPGYTRNAPQETAVEQTSRDDDDEPVVETQEERPDPKSPEEMTNTNLRMNKAILTGVGLLNPFVKGFTSKRLSDVNAEIEKRKAAGIYDTKYDDVFDTDLKGMFEEDFGSPEKFKAAMDYVAPTGMKYDPTLKSTVKDDDGNDVVVTGGYVVDGPIKAGEALGGTKVETTDEGVDVFTGSKVRPKLRPGSASSSTESSSKGLFETLTGKKFSETKLGQALGIDDDEEE